jgi:hypothetical protein
MSPDVRWLLPAAIFAAASPCLAARYMSVEQARALIFPSADEYIAKSVQLTPEQMEEIGRLSGVPGRSPNQQVWRALSGGRMIGWLFVDQVIGKHELITYALGLNVDGTIRQFEVIEYLEVQGSQVRYPHWREQFVGKSVESRLELDSDISNLSGATLSARHLTDGIKRLLFLHKSVLR